MLYNVVYLLLLANGTLHVRLDVSKLSLDDILYYYCRLTQFNNSMRRGSGAAQAIQTETAEFNQEHGVDTVAKWHLEHSQTRRDLVRHA